MHKGARKRKESKWAVSTDSLECAELVGPSGTTRGEAVETTREHALWQNWGQLSGGGPIPTNQGLPAAPDPTQLPALTIRLLPKVGPDKVQNTGQYGEAATTKTKGQPLALASMDSLRGPLARPNRANLHHNRDDGARDKTPVELRFPHNSKKWGLGVGQVPGERAL